MQTTANLLGALLPADTSLVDGHFSYPQKQNPYHSIQKHKQHDRNPQSTNDGREEIINLKIRSLIVCMENLLELELEPSKTQAENRWNEYGAPWLRMNSANQNFANLCALKCYKRSAGIAQNSRSPINSASKSLNKDSTFLYRLLLDLRALEKNGHSSLQIIPAASFIDSLRTSVDFATGIGH